ncbi:hypothetical protein AcV5_007233 [Taiwanofungus camphoratus]|nr:hypothetical protein AcV5_007233 [Antrodia cinnamomea]
MRVIHGPYLGPDHEMHHCQISAWNTRKSVNPNLFVRSHVAAYFVSLLLCDLIQAMGSIMNARWYVEMAVTYEPFCTAQGIVKQVADVSTSIWSLIIALHTFLIIFLRWNMRQYVLFATLVAGWGLVGIILIIGPARQRVNDAFFGLSGYWCWISNGYPVERVTLDYMWLFFSAVLSFVLYTLVLLKLRGNISPHGLRFRRDPTVAQIVDDRSVSVAKQMLLYPVAYTVLILPIAVCRFVEWSGHNVPDAVTFFSDSVFLLSGLVNVTLFAATRRVLPKHSVLPRSVGLWLNRRKTTDGSDKTSTFGMKTPDSQAFDFDIEQRDAEKFDVEKLEYGDDAIRKVDLHDRIFKHADSPDSDSSSVSDSDSGAQVTVQVQSMVVDHILLAPDAVSSNVGVQSPPGLTPEAFERISLDNSSFYTQESTTSPSYSPLRAPRTAPIPPASVRSHTVPPSSDTWF